MKKLFSLVVTLALALTASADNVKLADVIKATADTCKHDICPVFLNAANTYELDTPINLGKRQVWIWGGGAKVVVSAEGQITTGTALMVRNLKFDCSAATKAIFGMDPAPEGEPQLLADDANQKVYACDEPISIEKCLFSDLKQPLFTDNGKEWAIRWLTLYANVIQISEGIDNGNIINFSSARAAIKHLRVNDNLIYNTSSDITKGRFMRYGNSSNTQPQKIWGTIAGQLKETADFTFTNNTIAFYGKEFANNIPNTGQQHLVFKKNIFVNTRRIQKIGSNSTRDFEAADNSLYWNIESEAADASDIAKFAAPEDLAITVPTTVLDLDKSNALSAALPFKAPLTSVAGANGYGVSTAAIPFKTAIAKAEGLAYEVVLTPDVLVNKTNLQGKEKPAVNEKSYPWITYINPTSTEEKQTIMTDGTPEVQTMNRWTDINPTTGEAGTFIQVTGKNGSVNSMALDADWDKTAAFYVKGLTKLTAYVCGSSSNKEANPSNLKLTVNATDGTTTEYVSDPVWGKGTKSAKLTIELNPELGYEIVAASTAKTIGLTGLNLFTADETAFPICHAPGEKTPGTCYEVVLAPDMITTKTNLNGAEKPAIDDAAYPWAVYNNPTSTEEKGTIMTDGTGEVQTNSRALHYNVVTGEAIEAAATVVGKNGTNKSIVVSPAWGKNLTLGIKQATKLVVYAVSSASGSAADGNAIKATVTDNVGNTKIVTTTPGELFGKGTTSAKLEIALDADKLYSVTIDALVGKDIQLCGFNIYGTDLTVAPVEDAPAIGDATAINSVSQDNAENAPMYNVAGQRVNQAARGLVIKNGKKYILR